MSDREGISIIIPTYNGGRVFSESIEKISQQEYPGPVQLIVIDSGSIDGTKEIARGAGAVVIEIEKNAFRHGRTRNMALAFAEFDKVVYMVQDAIPFSRTLLSDLNRAILENNVSAVYTRQVPLDDANLFARFELQSLEDFMGEDPVIQHIKSAESFYKMTYEEAYRAIRLDNVCAIYRKEALKRHPFPDMDFAEDMAWALEVLLVGHRVMYQPSIKVKHSHNRSPEYGFRRQIVNSKACAQIMGRVRDDLSFLTLRDLAVLTSRFQAFRKELRAEITQQAVHPRDEGEKAESGIEGVARRILFEARKRKGSFEVSPDNPGELSDEGRTLEEQAKDHIRNCLRSIQENHEAELEYERPQVIEQLIANTLGRLYGEAYASRVLRGAMSQSFEDFISQFLEGV